MSKLADFIVKQADSAVSEERFWRRPAAVLIGRFADDASPAIASEAIINAEPFATGKTLDALVSKWPTINARLAQTDPESARDNAATATLAKALAEDGLAQFLDFVDRDQPPIDVREFSVLTYDMGILAGRFKQPAVHRMIGQAWLKAAETQIAKADEPGKAIIIGAAFEMHTTSKIMSGAAADFLLAHIGDLGGEFTAKREPLYRDASLMARVHNNGREARFARLWSREIDNIRASEPPGSNQADFLCADAINWGGEQSIIGQIAASKTDKRLAVLLDVSTHGARDGTDTVVLISKDQLRHGLPWKRTASSHGLAI